MNLNEETVSSEQIFKGKIITVRRDTVRLPNGNSATREIVEHPGGVAIVALNDRGEVYVERQYRHPFGKVIMEIPAGKLDADEDPFDCCVRELHEETGLSAGRYDYLGKFMLSPGFCREWIHIYLARDLSAGTAKLDPDEFLELDTIPFTKLMDMIMNNEVEDAKTVMGILKTNELLKKEA